MISLLESEFVEKRGWISHEDFADMVVISESTPGPIAINCATYIGYRIAGFWGSVVATIAISVPSFAIILLISLFFNQFMANKYFANAFKGIQACVIFLIARAGVKLFKSFEKSDGNIVIFAIVLCCYVAFSILAINFSSIFFIIISGFVGLSIFLVNTIIRRHRK